MTWPPPALVIAYHGIGDAEPPLSIPSERLREHLDLLVRRGTRTLKLGELAASLRAGSLPPDTVALTFDDGCASVATVDAHYLRRQGALERVLRAPVHPYLRGRALVSRMRRR